MLNLSTGSLFFVREPRKPTLLLSCLAARVDAHARKTATFDAIRDYLTDCLLLWKVDQLHNMVSSHARQPDT